MDVLLATGNQALDSWRRKPTTQQRLLAIGLEIDANVQGLGGEDKENPEQGPRKLKVSDVGRRLRGSGWVGRRRRRPLIGLRRSLGGV